MPKITGFFRDCEDFMNFSTHYLTVLTICDMMGLNKGKQVASRTTTIIIIKGG